MLGLKFNTKTELATPFCRVPVYHTTKQADPMQVRIAAHFEILCNSPNEVVAHIAAGSRCLSAGTMRFRHVQRSAKRGSTKKTLLFYCKKGKNRGGFF